MPVSTRKSTQPTTPGSNARTKINVYHISTLLLLFFAVNHTIGGLFTTYDFGTAANAVFAGMKSSTFDFFGSRRTYYDFYLGFGLYATVFLLFSAALSWQLSRFPNHEVLQPVKWILFLAQVANVVLSWRYFFIAPVIVSTIITFLLGWGLL
jgi:hypothetical protein